MTAIQTSTHFARTELPGRNTSDLHGERVPGDMAFWSEEGVSSNLGTHAVWGPIMASTGQAPIHCDGTILIVKASGQWIPTRRLAPEVRSTGQASLAARVKAPS